MQTIDELLELAEQQTPPEAAIPFLEQAVRLADAQQDRDAAFRARVELVRAASFSGFPDKALIHFAWLIGTFDRHRAQFERHTYIVMWMYKWILAAAIDNPAFPLGRLQRLEADFERRTREYGFGAHYQAYHRLMLTKQMGDAEGAQAAFLAWRSLPRDMISDCEACEQNKVMGYYAWRGNAGAAVKLGRDIIDQGMSCHNVPTVTYANLLLPLLATGDADGARHAHREGLRLARSDRNFIETIAEHLRYLLVVGEVDAALGVWAEHLPLALGVRNRNDLFEFLGASAALWRALEGAGTVRVALPPAFALRRADDTYAPERLSAHFLREAATLAGLFDARNGTGRYAERLGQVLALRA
ncbi:hypothetical protein [Deinococcus maricopensis]|uniref:Uncharacterized protein n=1 Tax=Deinococcus maricopensis (strain DSM 21211 / LMG 22137 / NRRL B-23946 / LB-34) TaxID=709986 RepID=E8UBA1_DEIML|nr:hypothetical protein [Deinococcus maricopensis]ADV68340.1 hypothetical protein Deima_2710 [Deinococcus maricopensis DSM 21211]